MMKGTEGEPATSSKGGWTSKEPCRKKVPIANDKENFDVYGGDVGLDENKSPLPVGYARVPLQDITAVLRPVNKSDEEDPSTGGVRKPLTRSQGLRKMGNVHTSVSSERISKNVNRAGPNKTRKKQVIKIALDELETVKITSDAGKSKQESTQRTSNLSSSVNLAVSAPAKITGGQRNEAQKQTRPLSERSSVSRFR